MFNTRNADRLASADIVAEMHAMEAGAWLEWRGKNGNWLPRPITQAQLADVLHDFQIKPRTIRPQLGVPDAKTKRGYHREDFEAAWAAYCPSDEQPTRRAISNVVVVRGGRRS